MTLFGVASPLEVGLKAVYLGLSIQIITMKYNELTVLFRFILHGLDLISRQ